MDKDQILKKWLTDDLTASELDDFKKLDDYDLNVEIIESAQYFKAFNESSVQSYEELKASLKERTSNPVIQLNSYKKFYRIAALFIVGFSTYFFFSNKNITTVQTLASKKITFELPDASSVTLNADSKAEYNKKGWSDKREISLEGEAFFKVAKGSKFDVLTSGGTVTVVGTQFSVNNRGDYFEVKCFEGIVSVNSNGTLERLTRGKTVRILNGVKTVDTTTKDNPEWLHNISSFKSVPLSVVIKELERQYDVVISTDSVNNVQRLFTGGFVHNNLKQALKSILTPLNLDYKKESSNKIILYDKEKL